MSKKKQPLTPSPKKPRRPWMSLTFFALLLILIGWGDDIYAWYRLQTDARAIKAHDLPAHLDGLTDVTRLTTEPFDIFCLLTPKQTAVGEGASLLETKINDALQKKFPRGVPDGTWAFIYADAAHVRIDTYEQEIEPYHFTETGAVQSNTMTNFMDDVRPATCAKRGEAAFFTFPSRSVILVRSF